MTRLSLEIRWWIGLLLALQLVTSSAGIGLLARVSPAVDRILRENEYSVEAVEDMLALLAREPGFVSSEGQAQFREAMKRAIGNVTEEGELALVERAGDLADRALSGDPPAREQLITTLRSLSEINRDSMRRADLEAQRIGGGGAWAAALAGFAGFLLGMWVLRRLLDRLVLPVLQLDTTLDGARKGDPHRRCPPLTGPTEVSRLGENVNWLLDERSRAGQPGDSGASALRAALLLQIDTSPDKIVVINQEGVVAMNRAAYNAASDGSIAQLSLALREGRPAPEGWTVSALDGFGWSCRKIS